MRVSFTANGGQFRSFNAVYLQHAVLCADCDCVSDSPHDKCLVCGSRSLLNIARVLGGNLAQGQATAVEMSAVGAKPPAAPSVLSFPSAHTSRRKIAM